jgi:hypothetical protein
MSDIENARQALAVRLLEGEGRAAANVRRAAFENRGLPEPLVALAEKVARDARQVSGEDLAAAKAARFTEEEIFELVVCAAVGEAMRQHGRRSGCRRLSRVALTFQRG